MLHFGLPYLAKGFVFPSAKIVIKLQWQNRNELLVPIRALQWYRLVRYAGTDSSAMMVPIQALRWYRFKRYDGTVSPILSRNPVKARRYFKLAGKKYEYEPEEENPHEADYFLRGSAEELAAVKTLVDELTQKYGDAFNEFGLYIPMNILMKTLVGSRYYDGNLLTMNTDDSECIVLHAEANTMEPLLYALQQAFPNLEIEMKETKLR